MCSIFLGLFVAYGIGANDVANSFGTSVGAGALTSTPAWLQRGWRACLRLVACTPLRHAGNLPCWLAVPLTAARAAAAAAATPRPRCCSEAGAVSGFHL